MIVLRALILLLPALAVYGVMRRVTSGAGPAWVAVQLPVGALLGLGLASCSFVVFRGLVDVPGRGYLASEASVAGMIAAGAWYKGRRGVLPAAASSRSSRPSWPVTLAFAVTLAGACVYFFLQSWSHPHGEWDAWSIWNLRGVVLAEPGGKLVEALRTPLGSDYPLLVPALLARAWIYLGRNLPGLPAATGFLFAAGTVMLLVGSLTLLRSSGQALLGGILLLCTQAFLMIGTAQYADVPLGFFVLAALVLAELHDQQRADRPGLLVLSGMAAGLAAWTKNEGALFVVVFVFVRAGIAAWTGGLGATRRQITAVLVGLAPVLAVVVWFKLAVATPDPLVADQGFRQTLQRMSDPSRYTIIATSFSGQIVRYGEWAPVNLVPLFALWLVFVGIDGRSASTPSRVGAALTLLGVLGGYFLVYVVTPYDLEWHLGTSLMRLLTQLWPSALWTLLLMARPWDADGVEEASPVSA